MSMIPPNAARALFMVQVVNGGYVLTVQEQKMDPTGQPSVATTVAVTESTTGAIEAFKSFCASTSELNPGGNVVTLPIGEPS